jgi:hypothetical protein
MPDMIQPIKVGDEFYNVSEEYTWYDTVAIRRNLNLLSKQPPGWYATFALFAAATSHTFFNVRNMGNTDDAYCNLDTKDQTSYAFQADSISCAWWGSGFCTQKEEDGEATWYRNWMSNALWQTVLPFEASLTLKIQQDEKLKNNSLMLSPGYGPWGGGYGNVGSVGDAPLAVYLGGNISTQTQGLPRPDARFRFPNVVNIPRRASLSAELSLTPYARALLGVMPGPGFVPYYNSDYSGSLEANIIYGITVGLHGRRLVQQRGELHA